MRRDRHPGLVDRAGMAQQQIAVIHRQRQRAAGLEFAADHVVDVGDHRRCSAAIGRCTLVKRFWLAPSALKNGSSSLSSTIAPGRMVNSRPR